MNTRNVTLLVLVFVVLVLPVPSILADVTPKEVDAAEKKNYQVDRSKSSCCCGGWSRSRCLKWCCNPFEATVKGSNNVMPENLEAADKQSNPKLGDEKYGGGGYGGDHGGGGYGGDHGGGDGGRGGKP